MVTSGTLVNQEKLLQSRVIFFD